MKRLIISMFLLLYFSGCTASAEYVIGIGTGAMAASQKLFFEETAKYLEKEFGARTIELKGPIALGLWTFVGLLSLVCLLYPIGTALTPVVLSHVFMHFL